MIKPIRKIISTDHFDATKPSRNQTKINITESVSSDVLVDNRPLMFAFVFCNYVIVLAQTLKSSCINRLIQAST